MMTSARDTCELWMWIVLCGRNGDKLNLAEIQGVIGNKLERAVEVSSLHGQYFYPCCSLLSLSLSFAHPPWTHHLIHCNGGNASMWVTWPTVQCEWVMIFSVHPHAPFCSPVYCAFILYIWDFRMGQGHFLKNICIQPLLHVSPCN